MSFDLDPRVLRRLLWSVPVAVVVFALAYWWRGYIWQLALITALSVGALTFVALRTLDNLRRILNR